MQPLFSYPLPLPHPLCVSHSLSLYLFPAPTVSCFNILFIFHLILMRLFPTSLWSSSCLTSQSLKGYIEWAALPVLCMLGTCKTCSVLFHFLFGFPTHNSPSLPAFGFRPEDATPRSWQMGSDELLHSTRASTRFESGRVWCDLAYPALPWPGLAWLNKRRRTYKEQAVKWAAAATGNSYENTTNNNNSHT